MPSPTSASRPSGAFAPSPDFTDEELDAALLEANLPCLLATLVLLTGSDHWVEAPLLPTASRDLSDHDTGGFDAATQERIRSEAATVIRSWRDGGLIVATEPPPPQRLARILSCVLAESIPEGYGRLLGEEMGLFERFSKPSAPVDPDFHVVIVGAGLSGITMAVRLGQAGIPYTVIEKNADVGGTWHENVYPGCAVDTPSHLYSLSFDPKPDWTRYFARRSELAAYWHELAARHGVLQRTRFETMVDRAVHDDDRGCWEVVVSPAGGGPQEVLTATVVVSAVGLLNQPHVPAIDGLADFDGPVHHTARWDESLDLTGKRVAVIGTGASAMQFVPASAQVAGLVQVFQRTPQWAVPHPLQGREVSDAVRFLHTHVPFYLGWYRARLFWLTGDKVWGLLQVDRDYPHLGRAINKGNDRLRAMLTGYIESELAERPDLLADCVPDYPPYGKRLLVDNRWFRTLARDDVELITQPIAAVTATGIRLVDGTEHASDVIVLATGFKAVDVLASMEVRGRGGRSLREVWGEGDGRAYLGITVPGFPNFFCLYGPNTNTGHGGTVPAGTEMQVQHVTALIAAMVDQDLASVEVRPEVHDSYNAELDEALSRTVWAFGGTTTYYRNGRGRIVTNSPWRYVDYWSRAHEPDLDDFELVGRDAPSDADAYAAARPVGGEVR